MDISIDQARAFCAVVDSGSYNQAAERLHKSHPALIYLVRSLEQQCAVELFDRRGYRNTLTTNGRRIYGKCLEILAKVDELEQLCVHFNEGWEASIKIVFDGILPFDPFLKLFKAFKAQKVPTQVQTYSDYLDGVDQSFHKLNADMMISIVPVSTKGLEVIQLRSFKHLLVAHKDHPVHQNKKKWLVEELKQFDFLTIRGAGETLGLNTIEFEETASFFLGDFSFKKEAVLKNAGFGWLPQHLIESELKHETVLPVRWERPNVIEMRPVLYVRKGINRGRAIELIINFLKK